jgi:formate hydrogenlyase subunit 6/NADH:ubiquinone oxidoreductase subunit I
MPWIDPGMCVGCGICESACPTGAIWGKGSDVRHIDMSSCIRCSRCHDACPKGAVRHDSELIDSQVENNIRDARQLVEKSIKTLDSEEEGKGTLSRLIKHYRKEKAVIEETLLELERLETSLFGKNIM